MTGFAVDALGGRYQVMDEIGRGGMGVVFRAYDRLFERWVALKHVRFVSESWTPEEDLRLILAQEFRLLASLWHPHIITVLDYGFDPNRQPFYTMPLIEPASTLVEAAWTSDLPGKLDLFRQMLEALDYLHGRGVTHHDLKPSNVLVDPDARLHLLDFGLAATIARYNLFAGTPAYMPPEVLSGAADQTQSSIAADLYAVGVMLYEVFVGSLPFVDSHGGLDISAVINTPVDFDHLLAATGSIGLSLVIARLLAKSPEDRYADARVVLNSLFVAFDQEAPPELLTLRESYQRPPFVGRESGLAQLSGALERALDGKGSAWLIGGESGVGKSRLLDELRVLALTCGVHVLVGQGVEHGGAPYQYWRMPVRQLALNAPLSSADAAALSPLLPETDIDRPPPNARIDDSKRQQALVNAIRALFRAQSQPILLILEDLHWANESLVPLKALIELCSRQPLLIVGSYRREEAPDLPSTLSGMNLILLERLGREEITALSSAMMGREHRPEWVDLLMEQTEGNAFYLVEFMRYLADHVREAALSEKIVASWKSWTSENIRALIQRRFDRLPDDAAAPLRCAAIIGREIDTDAIRAFDPALNADTWLAACISAGVFEIAAGVPRFAHDKMREAVLESLQADEIPTLYQRAAASLEAAHPDDKAYTVRLYNLWSRTTNDDKTREYALTGGKTALLSDDIPTARKLLEHARVLTSDSDRDTLHEILISMTRIGYNTADFESAFAYLEQAKPLSGDDPLKLCDFYRVRAMLRQDVGGYEAGLEDIDKAIHYAQILEDRNREGHCLGIKLVLNARLGNLDAMIQAQTDADAILAFVEDSEMRFIVEAQRSFVYRAQGKYGQALDNMLDLSKRYPDVSRSMQSANSANIAVTAWMLGRLDEAALYAEKALRLDDEISNLWGVANNTNLLGYIATDRGDDAEAAAHFRRALTVACEIQAYSLVLDILSGIGQLCLRAGDYERAGELIGLALNHATTNEDVRMTAEPILQVLREKTDPALIEAAVSRGAALDLGVVVREILSQGEH